MCRRSVVALLLATLLPALRLHAATRAELLRTATRIADRVAAGRAPGRGWEDVPFHAGTLLLAGELERSEAGSGRSWVERVRGAILPGFSDVSSGDFAAYAQNALALAEFTTVPSDRAALLAATEGPLAFAERALHGGPPASHASQPPSSSVAPPTEAGPWISSLPPDAIPERPRRPGSSPSSSRGASTRAGSTGEPSRRRR